MARDRFKGALRELLRHSDGGTSDSEEDIPMHEYKPMPKKLSVMYII